MTPRLARATYLHDYKIHVTFDDGREGVIDLEGELWGEVFEPLKDTDVFRCFRMDTELDTIVWPTEHPTHYPSRRPSRLRDHHS